MRRINTNDNLKTSTTTNVFYIKKFYHDMNNQPYNGNNMYYVKNCQGLCVKDDMCWLLYFEETVKKKKYGIYMFTERPEIMS